MLKKDCLEFNHPATRKEWELSIDEADPCGTVNGVCYPTEKAIVISMDCPPSKLQEVIIHELLHACFPKSTEKHITLTAELIADMLAVIEYRQRTLGRVEAASR
jgi:hypothetical protein